MKRKIAGIIMLLGGLYYIIAEAITAISFHDFLLNTYLYHTISELGIPNGNSPLFFLMNSAFILVGFTLLFSYFYKFKEYIIKNKIIISILTVITAVGVMIVGFIHAGNPLTSGYHSLGAVMAILGGNLMLILLSFSVDEFANYKKVSLVLGLVGFFAFWIMFFNLKSIYMPVLERLSVYTLIIWNLLTGYLLFKSI